MTSHEIRAARESDTSELLALILAKAKFDGCLEVAAGSYDIYSSFIAKPGMWPDDLYVYETHRGQGIGKALVVRLCEIARDTGCGRIDWISRKTTTTEERSTNISVQTCLSKYDMHGWMKPLSIC